MGVTIEKRVDPSLLQQSEMTGSGDANTKVSWFPSSLLETDDGLK